MDQNQIAAMWELLNRTEQAGDYTETARLYDQLLSILVRAKQSGQAAEANPSLRALAFNYAHFLNKHYRDYPKALQAVELGMGCEPTPFGVSVAMAAKGEALWGLGRKEEAMRAFQAGNDAHSVNGRIETAYCMVRLDDPALYSIASQWVESAVRDYGAKLNENKEWLRQIDAVRKATAQPPAPAKESPKPSFLGRLLGKK
jgi:hypothetical protein